MTTRGAGGASLPKLRRNFLCDSAFGAPIIDIMSEPSLRMNHCGRSGHYPPTTPGDTLVTSGYERSRNGYDNLTAVVERTGGDLIQGVSHGYAAGKTIGNDHRFLGKSRVSPVLLVT